MRIFFQGLCVLCFALSLALAIDFYEVLGVPRDADEKQIRQAYRQLSKQYHPDKNQSPDAHEKFIQIGEAYEVLSDKEKKANYDRYGSAEGPRQEEMEFGDIFNQFFGGFGGRRQRGKPKGEDTRVNLRLSLIDFYNGKELDFDVEMTNICEHCEGSGSADGIKNVCSQCNGQGFIRLQRQLGPMIQTFNTQCDACGGKGHTIKNACKHCGGGGTVRGGRHYEVYLDPGTPRDSQRILNGEGDQNPDWTPGDLIFSFHEKFSESWGYRRIGHNLYRTEVLTLEEARLGGWKRSIPFFDKIDLEIVLLRPPNKVVVDNEVEIIPDKGMPIPNELDKFGSLYIEYKILVLQASSLHKDEL